MSDQLFKSGFALLIGVGSEDLPSTARDAKAIGELLTNPHLAAYPPDQVQVLTGEGARLASIRAAFEKLTQQTQADPNATVFLFFSGHGGRFSSERDQNYFLQPYDGDASRAGETMLSGAEFTHRVDQLAAKKLIVILDCCYAGGQYLQAKDTGREPEHVPSHQTLVDKLNTGSGRIILASCLDKEVSYAGDPYSVFTASLLEALKGANSRNENRYVHILDLLHHVFATVPERTSNQRTVQHPFVNQIDNLDTEFFICRYDPEAAAGVKSGLTNTIQQKLAKDFHQFATNYIQISAASQVDIESADNVEVTGSNVTINQTVINKDHGNFHQKLLHELGILPYLVNREDQDKTLFPQFLAIGQDRRHLVGVLHGAFDQYPQRYVDRLLHYLRRWIEKDPDPSLAGPKEISMVWPDQYKGSADLRRQVFNNFVSKGLVGLQTADPIDKFYRENSNRHLLFYTTLTIDPSLGHAHYHQVIKGFFEFWVHTPPRESHLKQLAILILIYPAASPSGLRRYFRLGRGLFGKKSAVKGLREILTSYHELTSDPEKGREQLLQKLAITAGDTSQNFVFPEVGSIKIDHIIQWLQLEECRRLLGNLNLGFRYQELFYKENKQALTMHEFETYLTAFIKDTEI